jgi:lipid-binding SYLF domain-containing protein
VKNAKGLAIFTIMRTGLWVSGAGGSGVLVSRLPDGSWSPPSAILLHTDGVAFLLGVDMYDCVLVINSDDAMAALSTPRYTIGSGLDVLAGPLTVSGGGLVDAAMYATTAPIYTYLKSRRIYSDVHLLGTILVERADENERFYHRKTTPSDILSGKISKVPTETNRLIQTIKAAQGDTDVDPSMLPTEGAPSEVDLADGQTFGVPNKDDPDPFGFLALEKEGFVVREAGSQKRASRDSFQFQPGPDSPLFNAFNRGNADGALSRRSSWRTSVTERSTQTLDTATQTSSEQPLPSPSLNSSFRASMTSIPETAIPSIEEKLGKDTTKDQPTLTLSVDKVIDDPILTPTQPLISMASQPEDAVPSSGHNQETTIPTEAPVTPTQKHHDTSYLEKVSCISEEKSNQDGPIDSSQQHQIEDFDADADDEDEDEDDESDDEVIIHEVVQAVAPRIITASPQVITKAKLITVNKLPPPPALPARNPIRKVLPQSPSPSHTTFNSPRPASSNVTAETELETRPSSSAGSSVYSLKKAEIPPSARATESLGSMSSVDDGDLIRSMNLNASLDKTGVQVLKVETPLLRQDEHASEVQYVRDFHRVSPSDSKSNGITATTTN